jgi:hypothetical protein
VCVFLTCFVVTVTSSGWKQCRCHHTWEQLRHLKTYFLSVKKTSSKRYSKFQQPRKNIVSQSYSPSAGLRSRCLERPGHTWFSKQNQMHLICASGSSLHTYDRRQE